MIDKFLSTLQFLKFREDDDSVDRMHYFWTSNILIATSMLISWKMFGGKPIECMVPKMFSHAWEQYAEQYCWAQYTYFVPKDDIVITNRHREDQRLSYYQWIPFFLLFMAFCFRLPSLLWRYLAGHSGIQIHDIVEIAADSKNIKPEDKANNIKALTTHLQNALRFHRRLTRKRVTPHNIMRPLNLPYSAFYVSFIYVLTKCCYLANVLFQFFLMNKFLGTDRYSLYGFGALHDILNGTEWETSGIFPRVTQCDFKVRAMGSNIQPYTVQCVLVINILNEKIFVFLWFWMVILTVLTAISLFYWLFVLVPRGPSRNFISRHLELSEMPFDPKASQKDVERFVVSYLKTDGIFTLRMITLHAGIIFGTDLVLELWKAFYGIEQTFRSQSAEDQTVTPTAPLPDDSEKVQNKLNFFRTKVKPKKPEKLDEEERELLEIMMPDGEKAFVVRRKKRPLDSTEGEDQTDKEKSNKPPVIPPKPNLNNDLTLKLTGGKDTNVAVNIPPRSDDSDEE